MTKHHWKDNMRQEGTPGGKDTLEMTGCQGYKTQIILRRSMTKVLYYPTGIWKIARDAIWENRKTQYVTKWVHSNT